MNASNLTVSNFSMICLMNCIQDVIVVIFVSLQVACIQHDVCKMLDVCACRWDWSAERQLWGFYCTRSNIGHCRSCWARARFTFQKAVPLNLDFSESARHWVFVNLTYVSPFLWLTRMFKISSCNYNYLLLESVCSGMKRHIADVLEVLMIGRWRLVKIDADLTAMDSYRTHLQSLICPSNTFMVSICYFIPLLFNFVWFLFSKWWLYTSDSTKSL